MIELDLQTELTPATLSTAVRRVKFAGSLLSEVIRSKSYIFIDLSRVEFADFAALASTALLVEAAVRHEVHIRLALPLLGPRSVEKRMVREAARDTWTKNQEHDVSRRIAARRLSLQFMGQCGFLEVLQLPHLADSSRFLTLLHDQDTSSDDPSNSADYDNQLPGRYPRHNIPHLYTGSHVLPLQWLSSAYHENLEHWKAELSEGLRAKHIAPSRSDASALVELLFAQLVNNSLAYSKEDGSCPDPRPLLGAISAATSQHRSVRLQGFSSALESYAVDATRGGGPLRRCFIGDSGIGIPASLSRQPKPDRPFAVPPVGRALKEAERSILGILSRRADHGEQGSASAYKVPNGLARATELVHTYQGAIIVNSGGVEVGYTFQDGRRHAVAGEHPFGGPGTLIEVVLPATPKPKNRPRSIAPSSHTARGIRFSLVSLRSEAGLIRWFPYELTQDVSDSFDRSDCIITLVHSPSTTASDIAALPERLNKLADRRRRPLVIVATTITAHQLAPMLRVPETVLGRETGQGHPFTESVDPHGPIMLIDAVGNVSWTNTEVVAVEVFQDLCDAPEGRLSREEIASSLGTSNTLEVLTQLIERYPEWLTIDNDGLVALRVTPSAVDSFLDRTVGDKLQEAVTSGSKGVLVGTYWTPTLGAVNRWLKAGDVADAAVGIGTIAYCLARRLIALGITASFDHLLLVLAANAPRALADALETALGLTSAAHGLAGEPRVTVQSDIARVPPEARVVVLSDIIVTENTARNMLTDLIRRGAEPVAIATIYDARQEASVDVHVLGRQIPTLALCDLDLSLRDSQPDQDIEPILNVPANLVRPYIPELSYPLPPKDLLAWCRSDHEMLYVGHIERDAERHFTTYLNPGRLLKSDFKYRQRIIDLFTNAILSDFAQIGLEIELWFPGPEHDFAGIIAKALKLALDSKGYNVTIRSLHRVANDQRFIFTSSPQPTYARRHIVIVDWGAITASSIQQMLRNAVCSNVADVKAVILTSQMMANEEDPLRRIRSLEGSMPPALESALDETGETHNNETHVSVKFLSALRPGFTTSSKCSLCKLRTDYQIKSRTAPSRLLRQYAGTMADRLRPVRREHVLSRLPEDLYGARVSPGQVTSIVELRGLLETAVFSTAARRKVRTELAIAARSPRDDRAQAWLRLVNLEPQWLKSAPLRYYEFRELLSSIARVVIRPDPLSPLDASIRHQAIIALRIVSKDMFIEHYAILLEESLGDRELAGSVLFGMYTFLSRPYHRASITARQALYALLHAQERISSHPEAADPQMQAALGTLIRKAEYLVKAATGSLSSIDAWALLRTHYAAPMGEHHAAINAAVNVLAAVEGYSARAQASSSDTAPKPTRGHWQAIRAEWQKCEEFLASHLMPYLPPLRDILVGAFYEGALSPDDLSKWDTLLATDGINELRRVDDLLAAFAHEPTTFDESRRAEAEAEVLWWYRFFLDAGPDIDSVTPRRARMLSLLDACPSALHPTLSSGIESARRSGLRFQLEHDVSPKIHNAQVFCPDSLLCEIVTHLLENAAGEKHAVFPRDEKGPRVTIMVVADQFEYVVTVFNDKTKQSERPGRGLASLNARLEPFGGSVRGSVPVEGTWSFVAEIRLPRWE